MRVRKHWEQLRVKIKKGGGAALPAGRQATTKLGWVGSMELL